MATRQQNPTRPVKPSTVQKPPTQGRKPASQQSTRGPVSQTPRPAASQPPHPAPPRAPAPAPPPAPAPAPAPTTTVTHNPTNANKGDGQQLPENTMDLSSVAPKTDTTEKPYLDYLNDYVVDWKEPVNLEPIKSPRFHNAGSLSPRLRPIGTPPSLVTYQNRYNLRQSTSPLPALTSDRLLASAVGVDSVGIDSIDYRFADNLDSHRRKPSPLSYFNLNNDFFRQSHPFGVETRSNPVPSSKSAGVRAYTLSTQRLAPVSVSVSRYPDLVRLDTFIAPGLQQEPSSLAFVPHEAVTNHYVEEFIGGCIEDQFVPDILHEAINELGYEKKKRRLEIHRHVVDPFRTDTDKHIDDNDRSNTHLYSDDWIRELGIQQRLRVPTPVSNVDSDMSLLRRKDFKEAPPMRLNMPLRFHDLMPDVQTHMLTDLNQEFIDFELADMLRDLSRNTVAERPRIAPVFNDTARSIYQPIEPVTVHDVRYESPKRSIDQDNLIRRYISSNDSKPDYNEDQTRLLDGAMLDNLIHRYSSTDGF